MTTWFVATRTCYVLVDAENEQTAREKAYPGLYDLYADLRKRLGREVEVVIHTVRPATDEEIGLWNWHHEMLAREAN